MRRDGNAIASRISTDPRLSTVSPRPLQADVRRPPNVALARIEKAL
jgi:hypothetical protein